MTAHKSDSLISEIEKTAKQKYTAKQKAEMRRIIRTHFCDIHKEACEATVMAINKKTLKLPNFYD